MQRALVMVERSEAGRELIEIAGKFAKGVDATLVLLMPIDESSSEENIHQKIHLDDDINSMDDTAKRAEEIAAKLGEEILSDTDISYEAYGLVGTIPDDIITFAESEECDHVFLTGDKRSPTGKALFGDTAQRMLLDFDGPVTSLIN